MFRGDHDPWHYDLGFNVMVDFGTWVLERDGLYVPPFDRHTDGDGALRARGLDAAGWRMWAERIVSAQGEIAARMKGTPAKETSAAFESLLPPALWTGATAVRDLLADLWDEFGVVSNDRKNLSYLKPLSQSKELIELRSALAPYWDQLPALHVYLVDYPGPVIHEVHPDSLIVGTGQWHPNAATVCGLVFDGAVELAVANANS
jgi:hypothetical protein